MTKPPSEGRFAPMGTFTVRVLPPEEGGDPDAYRAFEDRMAAMRAAARPPEPTGDEEAVAALVAMLDDAAAEVEGIGAEPILLAECPHKYNDAWYDDLWHAVQAGPTWWEQSQFFEESFPPRVEERARFETDLDGPTIRATGATLTGEQITALRAVLRGLQVKGWRHAVRAATAPPRDLLALVVEHRQRWLVLETPNAHDQASILAWDAAGLFRIGTMGRIDQAVGGDRLLLFETVESEAVCRLGSCARAYFHPSVVDGEAAMTLGGLLREAVGVVRATTGAPVALASRDSRATRSSGVGWAPPQSYAEGLRRDEGELRVPRNDVWPPYRPRDRRGEESPLSDLAKGLHTALAPLEAAGWRDLFGAAHGETLTRGQTLALLVSADRAVLMRDNAAFRVTDHEFEPMGVFPWPNLLKPEDAPVLQ